MSSNDDKHIRLVLVYGPQENDSVNKIADFYDSISVQVERANLAGDSVFLVGDFNAKLGTEFIRGEIHQMSNNGARLNDIMEKYTFTWVKNKIPVEKSVLDYVITSQDLVSSVNSLKIDEAKEFTPWRSLKHCKCYSDHNAILVHKSVNKHSKDIGKRKLVWNVNDPLGWEKFHKIISSDRSLLQCWQNDNDPEINYEITDEESICEEYVREFIHSLRKRNIDDDLEDYKLLNNTPCKTILQNAKSNISSEFTHQELGGGLKELKRGKRMDPAGFKMFINGGQMLTQYLSAMANSIKYKATTLLQWNKMYIQTLKRKIVQRGSYLTTEVFSWSLS